MKLKATLAGERLDRFELIAELASGGMATVFLARLGGVAGFQRFVAIKRLHPHLASENEFVEMFLDEARLAARIHHPNVVPIVEIGTSDQGYYLVMDYIEGDTAARLMARSIQTGKKLPAPIAIRIALDTLAGLHAAHELKDDDNVPLEIVHRDVSPQNILVGIDGTARITDFGVARAATRLSTTRSGQLKGKLAYMAPEQARGTSLDRRADLFAMGTVLWEMLAGKRLFKGDGEAETLNRILFEPIPMLRVVDPTVSEALEAVCMKALDREAKNRYATCAEMGDALEDAARSLGSLASAREVAAYVDSVIGTEISQQRDVVRSWLARSEPSRQDKRSVAASLASLPSVTGDTKNEATQTAVGPTSDRSIPREVSSPSRSAVSSVSSAAIAIPTPPSLGIAAAPADAGSSSNVVPFSGRRRGRALALASLGVVLVAVAFGVIKWRGQEGAVGSSPVASSAAPSGAIAAAAPAPTSPAAVEGTVGAADAASASSSAPSGALSQTKPSSAKPSGPHTVKPPGPPKPKPTPAATSAPIPDDISHNPYR